MSDDSGEGDFIEVDLSQIKIPDDPRELFEYEVTTMSEDDHARADPAPDGPPSEPLRALFDAATPVEQARLRRDTEWWARLRAEAERADAWLAQRWGEGRDGNGPEVGIGASAKRVPEDWLAQTVDDVLDQLAAGALQRIEPTVGMVTDTGKGLLYSGRVNGLAGESGGGKSWIAMTVGIEVMLSGQLFVYVDYEDSKASAVLRLVQDLGAAPELVRSRFRYVHPDTHSEDGVRALVDLVRSEPGAFVVIDSVGESLAAASLKQNADEDVASWFQQLAHPLAEAGATVLLLDHMVKSEDGGLWPIGSQRKRAAITGVQYVLRPVQPFSREADGAAMLVVAKDRHGAYEVGSTASVVMFTHPIESSTTDREGNVLVVKSDALTVRFGIGKTREQVEADRAAKASARLDADVRAIADMDPKPSGYRDVKAALGWNDKRAQDAMREWKSRGKS